MINLLPPYEKKYLEEEKKLKLILVLGIIFLTFFVSFSLILLVIRIIISNQIEVQKLNLTQQEEEFQRSQLKEFPKTIEDYNKKLVKLKSFYRQQLDFTDILEIISNTLPPQVYLTNIHFNFQVEKDDGKILNCNLSGFSANRESLLQFKNNLDKEEKFKEIYFPPSVWVESNNINFSISFKVERGE